MGVNVSLDSVNSPSSRPDSDAAADGAIASASTGHPTIPNPSGLAVLTALEHHHLRSPVSDPPLRPDVAPPSPLRTSHITPALDENPVSPSYDPIRFGGSHRWSPCPPTAAESALAVRDQGQHRRSSSISSSDEDEIDASDPSLHPSSYPSWYDDEIERFYSLQVPSLCDSSQSKHEGGSSVAVSEMLPPEQLFHQHRRLTSNCDDEACSMSFDDASPV